MISIIICSVQDARFAAVARNYAQSLEGEPHEIIRINDAASLAEGYTRGIARSHGEIVIFSHDDVEILTAGLARRLRDHLERFDLVGVAGTNRLIRGEWVAAGPPYIFGQVAQVHPQAGFVVRIFGTPARSVDGIQAMDGLFFAARRELLEKVRFDPQTFDGFHHYDLDFSFAAHLAGFRLGIGNDIHIIHGSWGSQDQKWQQSALRFEQKYIGRLHPQPPRPFSLAWVHVNTRQEVAEVMRTAPCS
jgi:GT2 family glycosyltransferase